MDHLLSKDHLGKSRPRGHFNEGVPTPSGPRAASAPSQSPGTHAGFPSGFFSSRDIDTLFEWDEVKADANFRKHKVPFEEAASVFPDPLAKLFDDEAHSVAEHREILIGHSRRQRLLLVSFTERAPDRVRIISARKATKTERLAYEENSGA